MPRDELELIDTLQELHKIYKTPVTYDRIWRLATSGRVPAQRRGRRWYVLREHIPALAEALGITA